VIDDAAEANGDVPRRLRAAPAAGAKDDAGAVRDGNEGEAAA
jgi:hypothetical protein